jgi:hypothetical protein
MKLRHLHTFLTTAILLSLFSTTSAFGQFDPFAEPNPVQNPVQKQDPFAQGENGEQQASKQATHRWRVGMSIMAVGGSCGNLFGTASVPNDWPEQHVKIVNEEITPDVRSVRYRTLPAGVKQMLVTMPLIRGGATATAIITFEVTRTHIAPPSDPTALTIPKRMPSSARLSLGSSPFIEARDTSVRSKANEIFKLADDSNDWDKVKAIHDWVVKNIELQPTNNNVFGAIATLRSGTAQRPARAGYEDLTNVFVALCRANKVPARIVWVPDHCYAEFYMEDADKKGAWYPASLAGEKEFGFSTEERVILQKGDNIKVPEKKEAQRYVGEFVKGAGRQGGKPRVNFVRQYLAAEQ